MFHRSRFLSIWLLALLVAACAATPREELTLQQKLANQGYELGEQVESIRDWRINGWNYIDDQHLVFHSGVRDRYLVTLRTHSVELRSAEIIGFSTTTSSVTDMDKVVVSGPGRFTETLFIESLYKLKRVDRSADST